MASKEVSDLDFRCPKELAVSPTNVRRVVIVAQCLLSGWPDALNKLAPGAECDFVLFNNVQELAPQPPRPSGEYDFQLVGVPIRSVVPDGAYFRLDYKNIESYEALFKDSVERLSQFLAAALRWNREFGLLTFVSNFLVPQQNSLGRLMPRYDLRNFAFFIERLNEALAAEIGKYKNIYLFDLDQIIATYGRRYVQDDVVSHLNHGAVLSDGDFALDRERLEAMPKVSEVYPARIYPAVLLGWTELLVMYRTAKQLDMVKLVVTDIDDTLWRGVAAERTDHNTEALEGWPLGYVEALCHLKRRGVLLALCSKNEESTTRPIWRRLFGNRLTFEDFAARKINWRPKAENFGEILKECNLLPRNVVFIDDNPVERASIEATFPGVRTLGPNPLLWRRILLWSAETQVAAITDESAQRTEMVKSQIERENQRKTMPREEFLASLGVEVEMQTINDVEHPGFPRALELTNKSNQFNTTGRRWTLQEMRTGFAEGMKLWTFAVNDRFTSYGVVGVVFVSGAKVLQLVMSCRVVGLEVETAVIAKIVGAIRAKFPDATIEAKLEKTELNLLARDLWSRSDFLNEGDRWILSPSQGAVTHPPHIKFHNMDLQVA